MTLGRYLNFYNLFLALKSCSYVKSTDIGQIGLNGVHVLQLAMVELDRAGAAVPILLRPMVVHIVAE